MTLRLPLELKDCVRLEGEARGLRVKAEWFEGGVDPLHAKKYGNAYDFAQDV